MRILLAVDGSAYTTKAVKFVASHMDWLQGKPDLFLLHVKLPISLGRAKSMVGKEVVDRYYQEEAEAVLDIAEKGLRKKNIPFKSSYKVGDVAREIQIFTEKNKIDLIIIGSHGVGVVKNLVMGSVATKVLALTDVPVLIVR